ncbi:hypothetical protein BSKO_01999 [Bryopsis sp. KO-2023]|nr:hypothetical protein BSKO_01999 [Bryopsis sp. KO-2023]
MASVLGNPWADCPLACYGSECSLPVKMAPSKLSGGLGISTRTSLIGWRHVSVDAKIQCFRNNRQHV